MEKLLHFPEKQFIINPAYMDVAGIRSSEALYSSAFNDSVDLISPKRRALDRVIGNQCLELAIRNLGSLRTCR